MEKIIDGNMIDAWYNRGETDNGARWLCKRNKNDIK